MAVNVRIEARRLPPNASKSERDRAVQSLLRTLKRACSEAGVTHELKEHEFFTRKCDIRRRKRVMKARAPMEAELKAKEEAKEKKDKKSYGKY